MSGDPDHNPPFLSDWSNGEAEAWANPIDYALVGRVTRFLEAELVFAPPDPVTKAGLLSTSMLSEAPHLVQEAEALGDIGLGYGFTQEITTYPDGSTYEIVYPTQHIVAV